MKCKVLYFHTAENVEIKTGKIKDGNIILNKNKYPIDKVEEPIIIKWPNFWFGAFRKHEERLYFIFHKNPKPMKYDIEEEVFKPEITTETRKQFVKSSILTDLLTLSTKKQDFMMWLIIGGIIGLLGGIIFAPMIGITIS